MWSCRSYIRRHISALPENSLFNNREFLQYGFTRKNIDFTLQKMTNQGELVREARGVYRKARSRPPAQLEIIHFKARVFGRRIAQSFADAAASLVVQTNLTTHAGIKTFVTDGASSSFRLASGTVVRFLKTSARKLALADSRIDAIFKAVWHHGAPLNKDWFSQMFQTLGRTERQELLARVGEMPGWFADMVNMFFRHPRVKKVPRTINDRKPSQKYRAHHNHNRLVNEPVPLYRCAQLAQNSLRTATTQREVTCRLHQRCLDLHCSRSRSG